MLLHAGNWTRVTWMKCQSANHFTIETLVVNEGDFKKDFYKIKAPISPILHYLPQIEMIKIGHKSLPIIRAYNL